MMLFLLYQFFFNMSEYSSIFLLSCCIRQRQFLQHVRLLFHFLCTDFLLFHFLCTDFLLFHFLCTDFLLFRFQYGSFLCTSFFNLCTYSSTFTIVMFSSEPFSSTCALTLTLFCSNFFSRCPYFSTFIMAMFFICASFFNSCAFPSTFTMVMFSSVPVSSTCAHTLPLLLW